jgi:peptide deformylase
VADRPPRVRVYGSSCLRRRAVPLDPTAADTGAVLDELWAALDEAGGVGLAAPQIDRNVRALVVREPGRNGSGRRLELVNPELVGTEGPRVPFEEGCLSFPGLYFRVWRPRGVVVSYRDRAGNGRELRDEGLVARVVQHEMDHLDGVLYIDRVPALRRWSLQPRLWWLRLRAILSGA